MSKREIVHRTSPLPVTYIDAKKALGKCIKVDECKSWADKALALKSYAKQMKDKSLANMAQRIRDRAVERGGVLLAAQQKAHGKGKATDKSVKAGVGPNSRKAMAKAAGLSPRQAKEMLRVAAVPKAQFEAMVEATPPATVTELAAIGTKKQEKPTPWEYSDVWIEWISAIKHLSKIPPCGLAALARPDYRENLVEQCNAAQINLKAWEQILKESGDV